MKKILELSNEHETQNRFVETAQLKIAAYLQKSADKGAQQSNEDALMVLESAEGSFILLSDGAGGHPGGRQASLACLNYVEAAVSQASTLSPVEILKIANQGVRELKMGAKCTAVLIKIISNELEVASVGDSEVILWNRLGKIVHTNTPHSASGFGVAAGHIEQDQSLHAEDRNLVHYLLGEEALRVDYLYEPALNSGNLLLMGSDGLFDNLSHDELTDLCFPGSFEEAYQNIVEGLERKRSSGHLIKEDDVSFVLLRLLSS